MLGGLEGAEHGREPAVCLEMGGGLAAAGAVEIGDGALVDDRERGPFRAATR